MKLLTLRSLAPLTLLTALVASAALLAMGESPWGEKPTAQVIRSQPETSR